MPTWFPNGWQRGARDTMASAIGGGRTGPIERRTGYRHVESIKKESYGVESSIVRAPSLQFVCFLKSEHRARIQGKATRCPPYKAGRGPLRSTFPVRGEDPFVEVDGLRPPFSQAEKAGSQFWGLGREALRLLDGMLIDRWVGWWIA